MPGPSRDGSQTCIPGDRVWYYFPYPFRLLCLRVADSKRRTCSWESQSGRAGGPRKPETGWAPGALLSVERGPGRQPSPGQKGGCSRPHVEHMPRRLPRRPVPWTRAAGTQHSGPGGDASADVPRSPGSICQFFCMFEGRHQICGDQGHY